MTQNESVLAGAITPKDIIKSQNLTDECQVVSHRGGLPTTDYGWAKLRAEEESRRDRIQKQLEDSERYPTAPTKLKTGFFIFREGGSSPTVIHPDRTSALQEANRLASKVPTSKFYVCQITDEVSATVNIKVKPWVN